MNVHSIILEGSRDGSGGRCCALNLTDLAAKGAEGFSLFPGQVILCEGVNPSGKQLIVRRIFDTVPLVPQPDIEAGKMTISRPIDINTCMMVRFLT